MCNLKFDLFTRSVQNKNQVDSSGVLEFLQK